MGNKKMMQYFLNIGWYILLLFSNFALSITNATEKNSAVDETQQVYDRKAVLFIPSVGLPAQNIRVPVGVCLAIPGSGISTPCLTKQTWRYPITNKNQALTDIQNTWLLNERFDKISVQEGSLKIQLVNDTSEVVADTLHLFPHQIANKKFQNELDNYLNSSVLEFIAPLLSAASQSRYDELSNSEKQTFIANQAKSAGIPEKAFKALMNSSFAIATNLKSVKSNVKIKLVLVDSDGNSYYETAVSTKVEASLYIYRYDAAKKSYLLFKKLDTSSQVTENGPKTTNIIPNDASEFRKYFYNSFKNAYKSSLIRFSNQLKNIADFKLKQVITSIDKDTLNVALTDKDGFRVGSLFEIQRSIDDKLVSIGYAKNVNIAKKNSTNLNSEFELIKGEAEIYDLILELPWTGLYNNIQFGTRQLQIDRIREDTVFSLNEYELEKSKYSLFGFRYGTLTDRGFVNNNSDDYNNWLDKFVGISFATDNLVDKTTGITIYENPLYIDFGLNYLSETNLGFGLSYGYGLGGSIGITHLAVADNNYTKTNELSSFNILDFSLTPSLIVNYFISHNYSLVFSIQYPVSLFEVYNDTFDDSTNKYEINDFSHGLGIWLSFQFSADNVGGIVNSYK